MKSDVEELIETPYIYTRNHIIYKVSDSFLRLTGYKELDILGKSLIDADSLLKSEHQLSIQEVTETQCAYIFTGDHLPIEVKISTEIIENEKVYYFEEQKDVALDFVLANFARADTRKNGSEAIFSYPECILLQHDEKYIDTLDLMDILSKQPLGKRVSLSIAIMDLLGQGISFHEFEVESISSDGTVTYWDINAKILSSNRNNQLLVSSFYDVTENVRERKNIEKQRNELAMIADNMTDPVNIIDKDGRYTYINKVGREALAVYVPQYIPDLETVTSKIAYIAFGMNDINPRKIPFEDTADQRVLRGETLTNHTIIGTSEMPTTYYVCDGTPIYDKQGNIDGGILVYKNVESEYKYEEYKALEDNVEDISIYYAAFSRKGFKINYMNEHAFQSIKEERVDVNTELDIIGKNFFEFYDFKDTDGLIKGINQSIENRTSYVHQHNFMKNGKKVYTKTIFQPVIDQSDEIEKIIALGIDISDEVSATRKMKKQLTVQEEIFINTSHELNTPLSVIFSGAQLVNLYLEKESLEDVRDEITNINLTTMGNCHRLIKLITGILDISKIESGLYELNLRNYNIVKVIDDIVQSVSEYTKLKGIQIIFDTDVEELIIALDGYKFDRILLNLISNAIKFSITDKIILIKLVEKSDNTISISVTDEGIGIDQRDVDDIFKKYIQVNRNLNRISEGTGLGLPLARSMAELHGGSLHVESALDKGSTFTIELPIRIVDAVGSEEDTNGVDRAEIIKYEFSDIYL